MTQPFQPQQAQIEVLSSIQNSTQIVNWFKELAICRYITQRIRLEAQTAIVESFTNAVQHAHRDLPISTPIKINIQLDQSIFKMMIWDQGPPYDFTKAMDFLRSSSSSKDLDPYCREQHWGQVLFLKLSQDCGWFFSYDRHSDGQNVFVMEKEINLN